MTLINAAEFLGRFDISPDVTDTRVTPAIGSASRRLRKWVGETAYADAALASPVDEDRAEELRNAEAHLTFHYALIGLNTPLSAKGVVATAQSDEGREMRKYLTPLETAGLATQFLEMAREIAEPYMVLDAVPDSGWVVTEDVL